jgi:ribosomal-protein-alanine N-acetyltransferase
MDTELVVLAQRGDEEAFASLATAVGDRLHAVAHRRAAAHHRHDAKETATVDRVSTFPTFPELFTERLVLRELTAADAPWYQEHFSRPEIVRGTGFPVPSDLAAAASELRAYVLDLFQQRSGFRWGITTREDAGLIGSAGLFKWVDGPIHEAEIGYDLEPGAWGRGYMHEALLAILEFAFGRMMLEQVVALVFASNERSGRVLDRLGFVREALLSAHGEDEHGVLRDEWRFVLPEQDWASRRPGLAREAT